MKIFILSMSILLLLFTGCDKNTESKQANNDKKNVQQKNVRNTDNPFAANIALEAQDINENEDNDDSDENEVVANENRNINIPSKWNIEDSFASLPVIDFRKFKSINNSAISKEEKEREQKAREVYNRLVKALGNKDRSKASDLREELHKNYKNANISIDGAYKYAQYLENVDKKASIKAYEWILMHWPESYRKWTAISRLQNLQNMYMHLYASGNYHNPDSSKIRFQLSGTNIGKVELTIYKVNLVKMIDEGLNPQAPSIPEHAEEVKKWTENVEEKARGRWFYQQIQMPKLNDPSYYILSVNSKYITMNTLFSTSRVSLMTKSDDRMLLCWAKDIDNNILKNSKVIVLKAGKVAYRGAANANGLFAAKMLMRKNDSDNIHVIIDTPKGQAVSGSYYYWYAGYYQRINYAYTDRPIYRPGQKVHYKGFFRERKHDDSIGVTKGNIRLTVYDQRWQKVHEKDLTMDEFGSISGEYTIPETAKLGYYYLQFNGSGYYHSANFDVQEYKKPEYEVFVKASKANVLQGSKMQVTANAVYYFGEPVKEADVEYRIYESNYWSNPFYRYDRWSWFHDSYRGRWSPYQGRGRLIKQGKGKLDDSGKITLDIDTRKNKDQDLKYTVEVAVIDKSRRKINGSGTFLATRSSFTLAVNTDRWSYRPGENVHLEILAQDYGSKPIADIDVTLKVTKQDDKKELVTKTLRTNGNGAASFDWKTNKNGYLNFYVEARDKEGNLVHATRSVWVADNSWRSPYSYTGLNIELEKSTYAPGEEVRGVVTTGYKDSWILMTTETHRIQSYDLVKLKGSVYTYNRVANEKFQPYVDVKATMMENNSLVQKQKRIVVPPTKSFLNIAVAHKDTYQPGQKATYTIKITDAENKPVVTQFSFGLVDEAIYSLRTDDTPDIRKAFFMTHRGAVRTNSSYYFYSLGYGGRSSTNSKKDSKTKLAKVARREIAAGAPAEDRDEASPEAIVLKTSMGPQLQKPRVRTEFADSAVWEPNVVTDELGMAKVSFTMPDNLTTWRATIRGVTISGKVGQTVDKVITRKNLMARLQCPRTFTERDEIVVSGVIHNYLSEAKNVVCRLKAKGVKLLGSEEQQVVVAPGKDVRVDWRVAVNTIEEATLELEALTNEESDAMRLNIPIVPYGIALRQSHSGATSDQVTMKFNLPSSSSEDRARLVVSVKPTLAGSMLESLEYLAGYPYGCVEQTMSRFLPSVIVAQTLQNLNMRHAELEENLPKYVAKGTERLYKFQHSDGGWGWWESDATNPLMTAYVMYGFAQAQKADFSIKSDVMSRGQKALGNLINSEKNFEHKCYMVFAYSEAKKPQQKWIDELYSKVDEMNDYCRALLLIMAKKSAKMDIANDLLKMLEKNAKVQGGHCHFTGKTVRYGWTDNPIETTAYCLKAIVAMDPNHSLIPQILKWLEIKKQGKRYQSTKDTAAVVFAFCDYLMHSDELNPNYTGEVIINGVKKPIEFHSTDNAALKEFSVKPQLGDNTITIKKNGRGKVYYSAYIEYYSTEQDIPAVSEGIGIKRKYFRLTPKTNADGSITHERSPLEGTIKQGEVFEVELDVSASRNYEYMMLQDYIPAGCEFEKDKEKRQGYYYYWSNKEYRDDRLVVFFGSYSGQQKIVYRLRAETPGNYTAMPARAEMMYFPEIHANSTQRGLQIIEKKD
ncbi:alpha-2-macroglobulin [Candidatus Uabimicrobium sp. HlEnr_7]|uniref:alpha-2-macroglobulin family protein n=1 Tax=Candidatus Uabimicrobium helgolandensis TaxID=3095367 RepID=UPI00355756F7